jgi:DNA mismatch repair ATPase MutS
MDTILLLFVVATLVFIVTSSIHSIRKSKKKLRQRIIRSWGKPPAGKYDPGDFESISSYFRNYKKAKSAPFFIDDITWQDLEINDLFKRLNGTETTAGEEFLYRMLRQPSFDPAELESRRAWIEFFRKNGEERLKIQIILAQMGKKRHVNVSDYFLGNELPQKWKTNVYRLLAGIALLSPLTLLSHVGLGSLLIFLSFSTNIFVHCRKSLEIESDLSAFTYIVKLVHCIRRLLGAESAALPYGDFRRTLQVQYNKVRKIGWRGFFLLISRIGYITDIVYEFVRMILLKEIIDCEYLRNAVFKHRKELLEIYNTVGLIDCLICIASFRESVPYYCEPGLERCQSDSFLRLEFDEIYHPMIENPVANSLAIDRSVLVTGSNASGKSTFLKTIAVNSILAQSFYTCLARKFLSPLCSVFTSMALRDNIRDGESYFIAEIKSIKRILDFLNDHVPCLCLIDEVLRGTNTVERIAASSQVLLQISGKNCLCIAASHDIELTFILEESYRNVHFQESITDDGIVFDYKLYEGRASSRNAIKLLGLMGYDSKIVDEAKKRADRFADHGSWTS